MISRKNNIVILFTLLTALNVLIFFLRDTFIYHKYASYSSLYSGDTLTWKRFFRDYPAQDLQDARAILNEQVELQSKPTLYKIQAIGRFLYNRFYKQLGTASPSLSTTPLRQFQILSNADSIQLWCGNFADMFTFFCWSEHIPSRVIEIINPGDHHSLNESYVSETGEWVVTDLTTNRLLIQDAKTGSYINLLQLRDSTTLSFNSVMAEDTGVVVKPFDAKFYDKYFGKNNPIYFYRTVNLLEVYKIKERAKRYFLPLTWYDEVDKSSNGNWLFFVKEFFIVVWLISLVFVIKRFLF